MTPLTYQQYCTDPAVRAAIESDVRRLRSEAIERWFWQPLTRAMHALFARRIAPSRPQAPTAAH